MNDKINRENERATDYVIAVFQDIRARWGGKKSRDQVRREKRATNASTVPFGKGREPRKIGAIIRQNSREMGWTAELAKNEVIARWPDFAGATVAAHTIPLGVQDSVLYVKCDSTLWTLELGRTQSDILTKISAEIPATKIIAIKVQGPSAPSWKHGPRSFPGRGPRDTYG
ncbi:MAG: DciA family protein [Microbacteriaceae bacterium]|nr:DciA family protein [Microbacteriaceae bacterium]